MSRLPSGRDLRVFAGYGVAAAIYVAAGVALPDLLLSFWVGLAYVVVATWLVPLLLRHLP